MKFQRSLTPRSTDVSPVNYSTLSDGSVMKIPMKSFHGSLPRNSTTLKISSLTFILLILTNPDPYLVYNLLLQFSDPFRYFLPKTIVKSYIPDFFFRSLCYFKKTRLLYTKQNFLQIFLLYHCFLHFPFLIPIHILLFLRLLRIPPVLHHLLDSL